VRIAGFDIETTGLLAPDHRIIEVYIKTYEWAPGTVAREIDAFETRIDPERSIALEAQRVHGISATDLIGKPKWIAVAPSIHAWLADADLLVGHNGEEFDLKFLNMEFERVGLSPVTTPIFDTMLKGRAATPTGKVPNLGELCFAFDVPYDPTLAHAASYDVTVMMECFFRGLRWDAFKLDGIL